MKNKEKLALGRLPPRQESTDLDGSIRSCEKTVLQTPFLAIFLPQTGECLRKLRNFRTVARRTRRRYCAAMTTNAASSAAFLARA